MAQAPVGVSGFLYCTDKLQDVCKLKLVELTGLTFDVIKIPNKGTLCKPS